MLDSLVFTAPLNSMTLAETVIADNLTALMLALRLVSLPLTYVMRSPLKDFVRPDAYFFAPQTVSAVLASVLFPTTFVTAAADSASAYAFVA